MTDKQFLVWLHNRIINVYEEETNMDFMYKFRGIITDYPKDKVTTNTTTNKSFQEEHFD